MLETGSYELVLILDMVPVFTLPPLLQETVRANKSRTALLESKAATEC